MSKEFARNLINAGVHFGHGASRWNPKMKPYIFTKRGMIHIIDVKETLKGVILAKKLLTQIASEGKDVVFVGTKRQAQKTVIDMAEKCKMHYISNRWLGGTLTNFRTIRDRLKRLDELEAMAADGSIESESKKRASTLKRELRKIKSNLDGVRKMAQLPGVVVVVDVRREYLALREAKKLGIPTIGIIDTDSNPDTVDIAIPANDDSTKTIELILDELVLAVGAGKTMATTSKAAAGAVARPARSRKRSLARADGESPAAAAPKPAVAEPAQAAPQVVEPPVVKEEPKKSEEATETPSE